MDKTHNNRKKIKVKYIAVFIAVAFFAAVGSISAPSGAHAASYADNLTLGDMVINDDTGSPSGNPEVNIYAYYQLALQANTTSNCIAAESHWLANLSSGSFKQVVLQTVTWQGVGAGYPKRMLWYFGTNAVTTSYNIMQGSSPNTASAYGRLNGSSNTRLNYRVQFSIGTDGSNGNYLMPNGQYLAATCAVDQQMTSGWLWQHNGGPGSAGHANERPVFIRNLSIVYPAGYEGVSIPSDYTPPTPPLLDTPNIKLMGVQDWRGEFSDQNFLTFDEVPFTCDGGLAPVINGELWNDNEDPAVLMDTFTANSTALFNIQLPKVSEDQDYRIVSWYLCDDGINEFSEAAHYPFTITSYGQLKEGDLFESCLDAEFPFVHASACLENVFTVINLLKFREVRIINGLDVPNGCYTLWVIDDWINRPGQQVCPAMPLIVRDLMTPVALFLLALATIRLVNRSTERNP